MITQYPTVSSPAVWGGITGTLASQSDLETVLNTKAASSSLATVATTGVYSDLTSKPTLGTIASLASTVKQDTLVSATNIKTVNSSSILGSGDLVITGGQSFVKAAGYLDAAAISNSNVNLFSKAITVSVGDVLWFEVHGRVSNGSGCN